MRAALAFLGLLLGCSDGGEPAATPETKPPGTQAPTTSERPPSAPSPAPSSPTVWNENNVATLTPKAPARQGKVPRPLPALPAYDETLQRLGTIVERYAGDPENPWAVAHGILARGATLVLRNGQPAVPHLFAAFAEPHAVGTLSLPGFPTSRGAIPVEPHTDLILKNLQEAGVAPDAPFPWSGGTTTPADLYRYTLVKTWLAPRENKGSFQDPNDIPWNLQALAYWAPDSTSPDGASQAGELQWVSQNGTPMSLDFLTGFTVAVLNKESAFLFQKMQKGEKFERQGEALFNYTCGGAHLLQGASYAVARGFGSEKDRAAVVAQVPLWFYRLPGELAQYDLAIKKVPKQKVKLLVQRMKFLGHFLESLSKMSAMGLYTPDDAQLHLLEGAAQNLSLTVAALEKTGTFDHMEELKKSDNQLYLDIVGDSGHAVRGLELALGRGTIGW